MPLVLAAGETFFVGALSRPLQEKTSNSGCRGRLYGTAHKAGHEGVIIMPTL
jgi:hypothetical protein